MQGHSFCCVLQCSSKGICDRSTGECDCFEGYEGLGCRRATCPNDCSGHGSCRFNQDVEPGYRAELAAAFSTQFWDAGKTRQCVCDRGWEGYDCSARTCPKGDDPLTNCDTGGGEHAAVHDMVQRLVVELKPTESTVLTRLEFVVGSAYSGYAPVYGRAPPLPTSSYETKAGRGGCASADSAGEGAYSTLAAAKTRCTALKCKFFTFSGTYAWFCKKDHFAGASVAVSTAYPNGQWAAWTVGRALFPHFSYGYADPAGREGYLAPRIVGSMCGAAVKQFTCATTISPAYSPAAPYHCEGAETVVASGTLVCGEQPLSTGSTDVLYATRVGEATPSLVWVATESGAFASGAAYQTRVALYAGGDPAVLVQNGGAGLILGAHGSPVSQLKSVQVLHAGCSAGLRQATGGYAAQFENGLCGGGALPDNPQPGLSGLSKAHYGCVRSSSATPRTAAHLLFTGVERIAVVQMVGCRGWHVFVYTRTHIQLQRTDASRDAQVHQPQVHGQLRGRVLHAAHPHRRHGGSDAGLPDNSASGLRHVR